MTISPAPLGFSLLYSSKSFAVSNEILKPDIYFYSWDSGGDYVVSRDSLLEYDHLNDVESSGSWSQNYFHLFRALKHFNSFMIFRVQLLNRLTKFIAKHSVLFYFKKFTLPVSGAFV